jgi:hypothetical protein
MRGFSRDVCRWSENRACIPSHTPGYVWLQKCQIKSTNALYIIIRQQFGWNCAEDEGRMCDLGARVRTVVDMVRILHKPTENSQAYSLPRCDLIDYSPCICAFINPPEPCPLPLQQRIAILLNAYFSKTTLQYNTTNHHTYTTTHFTPHTHTTTITKDVFYNNIPHESLLRGHWLRTTPAAHQQPRSLRHLSERPRLRGLRG